jgi:glycosyltransferase involved in cell wall biosynthesis
MAIISLVIPVFNEMDNLPLIYPEIKGVLDETGMAYEILFVDDGSSDGSYGILKELCREDKNVRSIRLSRNFGQQAAITAGLDHSRGDAVITMDCDLQDPPSLVPEMIRQWQEGYDVVFMKRQRRDDKFLKKYSALVYYKLLSRFSDIKFEGNVGEFRLIDKKVLMELATMREKSRYLRGMISWMGFRHICLNYDRPKRIKGVTGFSLLKMGRLAMHGILNFSLLPLRLGLFLGLSVILFGVGFLFYMTLDAFINEVVYPLYKWLSVTTFIFTGLLFMMIWILGEYIGKIYEETKDRPIYLIQTRNNFDTP